MTITRVGTTKKYAAGWESAFGGKRKRPATSAAKPRKPAKKKAGRKSK